MRRIIIAAACGLAAAASLSACGGGSTTAAAPTSAAAPTATVVDPLAPNAPVPAGLTCGEIGGVFVANGTDGRGDCEPADPRPKCHVPPAEQDDHYVAGFDLTPPFPNGTVAAAQVQAFLAGASNADCWKMPK